MAQACKGCERFARNKAERIFFTAYDFEFLAAGFKKFPEIWQESGDRAYGGPWKACWKKCRLKKT